jgi:hypothetical protein
MGSQWIEFVKAYSAKNKVSYKEAMSKAKASYKPKDKKVEKPKGKKEDKPKKEKKMTKKEMDKMEK